MRNPLAGKISNRDERDRGDGYQALRPSIHPYRLYPCLILFVLLSAGAVRAADESPILVYPVPPAAVAPQIDGVLDDACWRDAPLAGHFTYHNRPEVAEVQASLRVAYGPGFLYLAVQCDEPEMARVVMAGGARDSGVFSQESIEVFLDPLHDHSHYYQLGASISGTLYDAEGFNPTFDSGTKVAVRTAADSWTSEWAIPVADFGLREVKAGQVLGFNVCRDRYVTGKTEWMNWSQVKGGFHEPVSFGHLVLSPKPEQLGQLGEEFRKGFRQGPIVILGAEGTSEAAYITLARRKLEEVQAVLRELDTVAAKEPGQAGVELRRKVEKARAEVAPDEQSLQGQTALDVNAWSKMEMRIHQMRRSLGTMLWDARLAALVIELQ